MFSKFSKKLRLIIILSSIISISYCQIEFEKGYLIDTNNLRIECLIKNQDWKNNPSVLEFKIDSNDLIKTKNIRELKEFMIYDFSKFLVVNVLLDRSSNEYNKLTDSRTPLWNSEQLALKQIIGGTANLYSYTNGNLIRFFYSINNMPIEQLIYKKYKVDGGDIATNNSFQQQLWLNVNYNQSNISKFENIKYSKSDLEKHFIKYNTYFGDTNYSPIKSGKQKSSVFNVKVAPGINFSNMNMENGVSNLFIEFENKFNLRVGVEAEYLLPFNRNKWEIIFEPTYQNYNAIETSGSQNAEINYQFIDFPLGIRYYCFLNKGIKLFFNASFISSFTWVFGSPVIPIDLNYEELEISPGNCFAFGGGMELNKISFELRYYTNCQLLSNYALWKSDYSRISFILGYKLFAKYGR